MSTRLTQQQLVADLLKKVDTAALNIHQQRSAEILAVCLPAMAKALLRLGVALPYARQYRSWPLSVRFCVQMLNEDGLADAIDGWIHEAIHRQGVDDEWRDLLQGISDLFITHWSAASAADRWAISGAFSNLLTSADSHLVAERLFGAHGITDWGLALDRAGHYPLEQAAIIELQGLAPEQLMHVSDHGELAMMMRAGVLNQENATLLGEPAHEYLLGVEMGL